MADINHDTHLELSVITPNGYVLRLSETDHADLWETFHRHPMPDATELLARRLGIRVSVKQVEQCTVDPKEKP